MLAALTQSLQGSGAPFLYAIAALFALALAVGLERAWTYLVAWRADRAGALQAMQTGDIPTAIQRLGAHPAASLLRAGQAEAEAEAAWDAMGAEAALAEERILRRLGWLSTAGNLATMLGLLGTVFGLILAFQGLSDPAATERASRIGEGIATAMTTTAWGLLTGIPALAASALLDGRARRELALCEALAGLLARHLRRRA